jgi:predicted CoA-binding protein
MAAILERMQDRLDLMQRTRSIAIVGMSKNSSRSSHFVASYLAGSTDFDVYYVNPRETEIMGKPVYASLADLPVVPDMVDVFRRVDDLPAVTDEAIAVGATALWVQLGLEHPDAADRAVVAGLDVVQNRCLKIEHARFRGGLHSAGFNTGVIDSRRARLV